MIYTCNCAIYNNAEHEKLSDLGIKTEIQYIPTKMAFSLDDVSAIRKELFPEDQYETIIYLRNGESFYIDSPYDYFERLFILAKSGNWYTHRDKICNFFDITNLEHSILDCANKETF